MEQILRKGTNLVRKQPIVFKEKRVLTTELLAEIYATTTDNIKVNFNNHKNNFEEGKHYYLLKGDELREFKNQVNDIYPVGKRASSLYLWTERGANRHCKILDTDKAWEQFDNLEETYFRIKENKPICIEDVLINSLQEMKAIKQQLNKVNYNALSAKEKAEETKEEVQAIRYAVTLDTNSWRKDTATLINKIATKLGGFEHIQPIREEIYNLLDNTYGVKLQSRLLNKQKKMALEGVPKYKIDKINKLDVIADDKKLINGYVNIVGKMAIKYGVGVN